MKTAKNIKKNWPPLQICDQGQGEKVQDLRNCKKKKRILKSAVGSCKWVKVQKRQTSTSQKHIYSSRQVGISGFLWQTADNVEFKVL